jgi:hypothetical protein
VIDAAGADLADASIEFHRSDRNNRTAASLVGLNSGFASDPQLAAAGLKASLNAGRLSSKVKTAPTSA